jgi:hypothetical protein
LGETSLIQTGSKRIELRCLEGVRRYSSVKLSTDTLHICGHPDARLGCPVGCARSSRMLNVSPEDNGNSRSFAQAWPAQSINMINKHVLINMINKSYRIKTHNELQGGKYLRSLAKEKPFHVYIFTILFHFPVSYVFLVFNSYYLRV